MTNNKPELRDPEFAELREKYGITLMGTFVLYPADLDIDAFKAEYQKLLNTL